MLSMIFLHVPVSRSTSSHSQMGIVTSFHPTKTKPFSHLLLKNIQDRIHSLSTSSQLWNESLCTLAWLDSSKRLISLLCEEQSLNASIFHAFHFPPKKSESTPIVSCLADGKVTTKANAGNLSTRWMNKATKIYSTFSIVAFLEENWKKKDIHSA